MKRAVFLAFIFVATFSPLLFAGVLSGSVHFKGAPPSPQKVDMNADPACASAHTEPVYTEEVVVNSNNTLKNVFVYVKEGLEGKTFETPQTPIVFDQKGCKYEPHVFGIQVNQPLEIRNSDATLHNVHGMPKETKEFNLGMPIQGMKLTRKFDKPEMMVKFKCDVHPWMSAYAGVLAHPYYSATGIEGKYEIKDLPAGRYVIEAWHEKYGAQTQEVVLSESGDQSLDFTYAG